MKLDYRDLLHITIMSKKVPGHWIVGGILTMRRPVHTVSPSIGRMESLIPFVL